MLRTVVLLSFLLVNLPATAAPKVVVSIAPLHSLVSGVMEGVAEPHLLIPPGASPHAYALKPSDARALSEAALIVWVGEGLETMLERPLQALVGEARVLELAGVEGMHLLANREGGVWPAAKSDAGHDAHGHEHGRVDLHLWLAPANARRIVRAVSATLSELDGIHAARYRENAAAMEWRITALEKTLQQQLAPVRERPYIVFHDAYHYFEEAFALNPVGAIAMDPERQPGVRRIAAIRGVIRERQAICLFSEPQFRSEIVNALLEGTVAHHGVLDPLGAGLEPGRKQWFGLMRALADNLTACLKP